MSKRFAGWVMYCSPCSTQLSQGTDRTSRSSG